MKKSLLKIFTVLALATGTVTASEAAFAAPSAVMAADAPQARIIAGGLELIAPADAADNGARFMVYSITGQVVKTVDVRVGSPVSVELPAGVYIVKCGKWSHRVVVR